MYKEIVIIGGGASGLSSLSNIIKNSSNVLLIEKENALAYYSNLKENKDGINKLIQVTKKSNAEIWLNSFATKLERNNSNFITTVITTEGIKQVASKTIILATGSREKTDKSLMIYGTRPAGIFTALNIEYYLNTLNSIPTKKTIIYGSNDLALKVCIDLLDKGIEVKGIFEKENDFSYSNIVLYNELVKRNIKFYKSNKVIEVLGKNRVESIKILDTITNKHELVECDSIIISYGFIPETKLINNLDVDISSDTLGPIIDQMSMTSINGLYAVGDMVIKNSDSSLNIFEAKDIGLYAQEYENKERTLVNVIGNSNVDFVVPEMIDLNERLNNISFYFKVNNNLPKSYISIEINDSIVYKKKYDNLNHNNIERVTLDLECKNLNKDSKVHFIINEDK